ncbi:hypothetical protein D3C79_990200 [compost metagenome]
MGQQVDSAVARQAKAAAGLAGALADIVGRSANVRTEQGPALELIHRHQATAVPGDAQQVAALGQGGIALGHFGIDIGIGTDHPHRVAELATEL